MKDAPPLPVSPSEKTTTDKQLEFFFVLIETTIHVQKRQMYN